MKPVNTFLQIRLHGNVRVAPEPCQPCPKALHTWRSARIVASSIRISAHVSGVHAWFPFGPKELKSPVFHNKKNLRPKSAVVCEKHMRSLKLSTRPKNSSISAYCPWCVACASRVGGNGGNNRVMSEKLTCDKAKQLPQQRQQCQIAWKCLRDKKTPDNKPARDLLHSWIRDPVQDGDVEPNPGPSTSLKFICVSSQGAANLWHTLELARNDQLDVVALQEIAFSPKEAKAFQACAFKRGFRFYYQLYSGANGRAGRGAGILVNKKLKSSLIQKWEEPDCQIVAVNINGLNLLSAYKALSGYAPQTAQAVLAFLSKQLPRRPWAIFGDWNTEPGNCDFCPNPGTRLQGHLDGRQRCRVACNLQDSKATVSLTLVWLTRPTFSAPYSLVARRLVIIRPSNVAFIHLMPKTWAVTCSPSAILRVLVLPYVRMSGKTPFSIFGRVNRPWQHFRRRWHLKPKPITCGRISLHDWKKCFVLCHSKKHEHWPRSPALAWWTTETSVFRYLNFRQIFKILV